ncbi:hypothetical protein [Brevibacillus sp. DP1.3A]|uniref:hypothetical protein n=1 Tax=Brevibacillus sp. DP1.3A TaxID=2738867 RepID=UPI00156B6A70|nr:hypothetical protein [Brevibacillus sp. DP1.3A]MED1919058.1 hypothetical protein [Bacillus thuringiensis]UED73871.1 hypothetical protein HP399_024560 [Brevibacillus sp. DP1.3A]
MENINPKYVTRSAIEGLVKKIKLPAPKEFSQDWEYEVSDSSRVADFLFAYENFNLDIEEKFALMIVIISSYEDAMIEEKDEESWGSSIRNHLLKDIRIHKNTIDYWAMLDEDDMENCFFVTPFIREIVNVAKLGGRN